MRRTCAALALLSACLASPARAESLAVSLTTDTIHIGSNFVGADIVLFGIIGRDAATVSRSRPYDLVVTITGPRQTIVVRRKQRVLGVWVNTDSRTFHGVPGYYAAITNRPLQDIASEAAIVANRLDAAAVVAGTPSEPPAGAEVDAARDTRRPGDDFEQSLIRLKSRAGLYRMNAAGVQFLGQGMFRADARLPANTPVGRYQADVFLFNDGTLLSRASQSFTVVKVGFEQRTYDLAYTEPLLYGLLVVLLAVLAGWIGGVVFRRE